MTEKHLNRLLKISNRSFFLFGPRGTGKSTWLKDVMPDAFYVDLLDTSLFLELSRNPHVLEALVGKRPPGSWIVLDEIQKIPALLDEVHRLMETRNWRLEVKMASKWDRQWEKAMRDLHAQHGIRVERIIGIYTGTRVYHYDGVDIMPVVEFLRQLHQGNIF